MSQEYKFDFELYGQALEDYTRRDFVKAFEKLNILAQQDPRHPSVYMLRALSQWGLASREPDLTKKRKLNNAATADLQKCVASEPPQESMANHLAATYRQWMYEAADFLPEVVIKNFDRLVTLKMQKSSDSDPYENGHDYEITKENKPKREYIAQNNAGINLQHLLALTAGFPAQHLLASSSNRDTTPNGSKLLLGLMLGCGALVVVFTALLMFKYLSTKKLPFFNGANQVRQPEDDKKEDGEDKRQNECKL